MTVSRKEAEATLLRQIADGDGELVDLPDLDLRSFPILRDLKAGGYIDGQIFTSNANLRITAAGERYLEQIWGELGEEEKSPVVVNLSPADVVSSDIDKPLFAGVRNAIGYLMDKIGWPVVAGVIVLAIAALSSFL